MTTSNLLQQFKVKIQEQSKNTPSGSEIRQRLNNLHSQNKANECIIDKSKLNALMLISYFEKLVGSIFTFLMALFITVIHKVKDFFLPFFVFASGVNYRHTKSIQIIYNHSPPT